MRLLRRLTLGALGSGNGTSGGATSPLVMLMWGQSNQRGRAPEADLPAKFLTGAIPNAYLWTGASFTALDPDLPGTTGYPQSGSDWGAESEVAYQLATPGQEVYIIKHAIGGARIVPATGETTFSTSATGEHYDDAITELDQALATLTDPVILGLDWMQGETEAADDTVTQSEYEDELTALISGVRTHLDLPSLPVHINSVVTNRSNSSTINAALSSVASGDANATLNDTSGYTDIGDGTHYDGASQITRGGAIVTYLAP